MQRQDFVDEREQLRRPFEQLRVDGRQARLHRLARLERGAGE